MKPELWVNEVIEAGMPLSARAEHPLRWVIADVLDEMEDFHSEPLRMWAWEGMTYAAIARELGLAGRQSAHERVKSALQVFKTHMEEIIETATRERESERGPERELRGSEGSDGELHSQARSA